MADTTVQAAVRAGKLTSGLADESVRWAATADEIGEAYTRLTGDVFISPPSSRTAAPSPGYRTERIVESWVEQCDERTSPRRPLLAA